MYGRRIFLHNAIFEHHHGKISIGKLIDHKDNNTLNNRLTNLREATRAQNNANARKRRNTSSRFKGVSFAIDRRQWHVSIRINKRLHNLGDFVTEEEAACVYDTAAKQYFGEFARLNFPE
jgi:hypothetical protein